MWHHMPEEWKSQNVSCLTISKSNHGFNIILFNAVLCVQSAFTFKICVVSKSLKKNPV